MERFYGAHRIFKARCSLHSFNMLSFKWSYIWILYKDRLTESNFRYWGFDILLDDRIFAEIKKIFIELSFTWLSFLKYITKLLSDINYFDKVTFQKFLLNTFKNWVDFWKLFGEVRFVGINVSTVLFLFFYFLLWNAFLLNLLDYSSSMLISFPFLYRYLLKIMTLQLWSDFLELLFYVLYQCSFKNSHLSK